MIEVNSLTPSASKHWPARFWAKVDRSDDCWQWLGALDKDGYGGIRHNGRTKRAHRMSWELANGPIPTGMLVLHSCDNPSCVNLDHLFVGDDGDNARDRDQKGRANPCLKNLEMGPRSKRVKTHCRRGHPFSGDNLRRQPDGTRRCFACAREYDRRYRANKWRERAS